jgi:hypothetical protein
MPGHLNQEETEWRVVNRAAAACLTEEIVVLTQTACLGDPGFRMYMFHCGLGTAVASDDVANSCAVVPLCQREHVPNLIVAQHERSPMSNRVRDCEPTIEYNAH